jgi:hypothetical protein
MIHTLAEFTATVLFVAFVWVMLALYATGAIV